MRYVVQTRIAQDVFSASPVLGTRIVEASSEEAAMDTVLADAFEAFGARDTDDREMLEILLVLSVGEVQDGDL